MKAIHWLDFINIFADEWESTNKLFRLLLVITQPLRILLTSILWLIVVLYLFSGLGLMLVPICLTEGPVWLAYVIITFDSIIAIFWAYDKIFK